MITARNDDIISNNDNDTDNAGNEYLTCYDMI